MEAIVEEVCKHSAQSHVHFEDDMRSYCEDCKEFIVRRSDGAWVRSGTCPHEKASRDIDHGPRCFVCGILLQWDLKAKKWGQLGVVGGEDVEKGECLHTGAIRGWLGDTFKCAMCGSGVEWDGERWVWDLKGKQETKKGVEEKTGGKTSERCAYCGLGRVAHADAGLDHAFLDWEEEMEKGRREVVEGKTDDRRNPPPTPTSDTSTPRGFIPTTEWDARTREYSLLIGINRWGEAHIIIDRSEGRVGMAVSRSELEVRIRKEFIEADSAAAKALMQQLLDMRGEDVFDRQVAVLASHLATERR